MKRCVYPVVHHRASSLTLSQAELALGLGADGVFLISHEGANTELLPLVRILAETHPTKLIGVNFLGLSPNEAGRWAAQENIKALWVDDPGLSSSGITPAGQDLLGHSRAADFTLFASVAFKYQAIEQDPPTAACLAVAEGAIPTTSGSGTGHAPDVAKIKAMGEGLLPGSRLAVASGMTVANIETFLPWLTDILVATGVSTDAHHFDPEQLAAFIAKVHAYQVSP